MVFLAVCRSKAYQCVEFGHWDIPHCHWRWTRMDYRKRCMAWQYSTQALSGLFSMHDRSLPGNWYESRHRVGLQLAVIRHASPPVQVEPSWVNLKDWASALLPKYMKCIGLIVKEQASQYTLTRKKLLLLSIVSFPYRSQKWPIFLFSERDLVFFYYI